MVWLFRCHFYELPIILFFVVADKSKHQRNSQLRTKTFCAIIDSVYSALAPPAIEISQVVPGNTTWRQHYMLPTLEKEKNLKTAHYNTSPFLGDNNNAQIIYTNKVQILNEEQSTNNYNCNHIVQWVTTNNTKEQYKSTNIPMGNNTKIQYQYNGNTIPIIHNNINEWATLYQWV